MTSDILIQLVACISIASSFGFIVSLRRDARLARRIVSRHRKEITELKARLVEAPTKEEMVTLRSTLIDRAGAEKLVARVDLLSKDFLSFKHEFGSLRRQANAIGMKRVLSGVVPPPKEEDAA